MLLTSWSPSLRRMEKSRRALNVWGHFLPYYYRLRLTLERRVSAARERLHVSAFYCTARGAKKQKRKEKGELVSYRINAPFAPNPTFTYNFLSPYPPEAPPRPFLITASLLPSLLVPRRHLQKFLFLLPRTRCSYFCIPI